MQFSTALRNALLDQIETSVGTAARVRAYTGSAPGVGNSATGTLLYDITCPSDWMSAASGGSKAKLGTWQDTSADASGTPGYFRIWDSTVTTAYIEGTAAVGSGELNHDASISLGGSVTVSTFTLTAGNS
jgi:hypothetical protein